MKHIIVLFIALMGCLCLNAEVRIHMEKEAGVYKVPCQVNGLKIKFIFDTGAAIVSISSSYANMMLANGYLEETDITGVSKSILADGSVVENLVVNLREVKIGGLTLKDVTAYIVTSQNAPLLLGQSVIQRLGKVSIDGEYLVVHDSNIYTEEEIDKFYEKAIEYYDKNLYSEALKYFKIVYEHLGEETSPWILLYLGVCYYHQGDEQSELNCFYKAIEIDCGENEDAVLFNVYSKITSQLFLKQDYNKALENAKLMEEYSVDMIQKAESHLSLCEIYKQLGKFSEGLLYSNKSIEEYEQYAKKTRLSPSQSWYYMRALIEKGHSLIELSKYEEAINAYQTGKKILEQYKTYEFYHDMLDEYNISLSECYEKLANH